MIKLSEAEFADLLPEYFRRDPDVKSISYAVRQAIKTLLDFEKKTTLYGNVDAQPDEILDLMAIELKSQYYREDMKIETKREIIKNTIAWHMKAGTKSSVEELVKTVFGNGKVTEWYEFDGIPGTFDISTNASSTSDMMERFLLIIENAKNATSHLRSITTEHDVESCIFASLGVAQQENVTIQNDIRINNPEQSYLQSEYIGVYDFAEASDETEVSMPDAIQMFQSLIYLPLGLVQCEENIFVEKGNNETKMKTSIYEASGVLQESKVMLE
ncbi:MAG: phage tail protein I [Eubacteriales bacterium]|nr:phage tail protein I [Eubacteriales bacterium]